MTLNDVHQMLRGALVTAELAAGTVPGGTVLAVLLVLLGTAKSRKLRMLYAVLRWLIRGTPLALLALLVFYALNAHGIRLSATLSGVLVLSLYVSVLFAEVMRGAWLALPASTLDSARSLGLPPLATFRKVLAPLILRQGLPAYVNVCVMAIKYSSVLSIIGVWELTLASREIVERDLDVFSVLATAAAMYFVMCFAADRAGRWLERRLARRGFSPTR